MAEIKKALDCLENLRDVLNRLPKKARFSQNSKFSSDIEEITLELSAVEEKIRELGISLDAKIHWKCEVPLRLIAIIGMLTRSIDKCASPELADFRKEISAIQSEVSKLSE